MAAPYSGSAYCLPLLACTLAFQYDWDEVGRLARARRFEFAGSGFAPAGTPAIDDVAYKYDAGNQRVLRADTPSGGSTKYTAEIFPSLRLNNAAWQGSDYERTPATEAAYLVSGGASVGRLVSDASLPRVSSSLHVFLEVGDTLGSTTAVIDRDASELVEAVSYLGYGADDSDYRPSRWGGFHESYGFTGKEREPSVGLTYFGARYYSAELGRWLSPDPLAVHGLGGDLNPYGYVRGNVMGAVDAWGLDAPPADAKGVEYYPGGNYSYVSPTPGIDYEVGNLSDSSASPAQTTASTSTAQAQLDTMGDPGAQPVGPVVGPGVQAAVTGYINDVNSRNPFYFAGITELQRGQAFNAALHGDWDAARKHVGLALSGGASTGVMAVGMVCPELGGGARAAEAVALAEEGVAGARATPNIVYRGLAAGEDAAAGLAARAPDAGNSVASHVAGARASQWISTTRSLDVAKARFGANGVVAIDLGKVGSQVVDLTKGIPGLGRNTMLSRWAINAREVLIQGSIPAEAITPVP